MVSSFAAILEKVPPRETRPALCAWPCPREGIPARGFYLQAPGPGLHPGQWGRAKRRIRRSRIPAGCLFPGLPPSSADRVLRRPRRIGSKFRSRHAAFSPGSGAGRHPPGQRSPALSRISGKRGSEPCRSGRKERRRRREAIREILEKIREGISFGGVDNYLPLFYPVRKSFWTTCRRIRFWFWKIPRSSTIVCPGSGTESRGELAEQAAQGEFWPAPEELLPDPG